MVRTNLKQRGSLTSSPIDTLDYSGVDMINSTELTIIPPGTPILTCSCSVLSLPSFTMEEQPLILSKSLSGYTFLPTLDFLISFPVS